MGFEVVALPPRSGARAFKAMSEPAVRIWKSTPRLMLNAALMTALDVRAGDSIVLEFDKGMGHVGLRPVRNRGEVPAALLITGTKTQPPGVTLQGLVTFHGLHYRDAAGIYRCEYLERERMWMFALPAGTWNRVRRPLHGKASEG